MLIKSVEVTNFKQYAGKNKIMFSTEKDRNVTIILARNGVGKTTLADAMRFCLFGEDILRRDKNYSAGSLLNFGVASRMNGPEDIVVELEFLHDNSNYKVKRSMTS